MIALVRHPAVDAGGRCYGRLDLPVADPASVAELAGRIDAFREGQGGGAPPAVWTSPARRCRAVAEVLGTHRVDDRLQELDFGAWEGLAWDDVPRASLDAWAADPWRFAPPQGESGEGLVARVGAFIAEQIRSSAVIITHGGPLKVLRALCSGAAVELLAPAPPPGSICLFTGDALASASPAGGRGPG